MMLIRSMRWIGLLLLCWVALPVYAAACTDLKPVHKLEDLLAQLYAHLDVNAHVKLHQEIRVWALKSAPP